MTATETEKLKQLWCAAERVVEMHDKGLLSRAPKDSAAIESLRWAMKESSELVGQCIIQAAREESHA